MFNLMPAFKKDCTELYFKRGIYRKIPKLFFVYIKKFFRETKDSEPLDPKILAVFDQDKEIAKKFFKGSRKTLIKELLKLESPHINYNLIVKLMNNKEIHDPQIAAICQNIPINQDERTYQKNTLARLESSILFHLERPLLHKNTRKLESEFYNAALIVNVFIS